MFSTLKTLPDYRSAFRSIKDGKGVPQPEKTVRIAHLANFTTSGMKEILSVESFLAGFQTEFYAGKYNQFFNEIMDLQSDFYAFAPEIIILFLDTQTLCGEDFFFPYEKSTKERRKWVKAKTEEMYSLVSQIKENIASSILLHNFETPLFSPLGILENKQEFGFIEAIEEINNRLRSLFKTDPRVFVIDYNSFCSAFGKTNIVDLKMYYLGDIRLGWNFLPALCDLYLSAIKPLLSLNKKCLVLDLDNTLWGGVIGEDGIEGIRLGPTPEGRSFWEMQKVIYSLYQRGVILAVNSKNNRDDALEAIRNHPHMVLKETCFASFQMNWNDKVTNMKKIAEEINIGLDSLVFIDDDKFNREMVRNALPEIKVIDLPEDTSLYANTIRKIDDFNTITLSAEDKKRGKMYAELRKRKSFSESALDIDKYLEGLNTTVTIENATPVNIPRIAQLTQKTNQFNVTTRRYQEEAIKKMTLDPARLIVSLDVRDKFGENGLTGVLIVVKTDNIWRIDTLLLSCRVLGRKVEEALLFYIIEKARKEGATELWGEFIPTKKNAPAKDFFKKNGFELEKKDSNHEHWLFLLKNKYSPPLFIQTIQKGEA